MRRSVAHVTTIDGSLRYLLLNQLCSIKHAGYDVVGLSSPGPDVTKITEAGIRHISVAMHRSISPLRDLVSLWQLYQTMRRERFLIVHTHNPKPGLLGQLAARLARVPVVVNTVHGFYFHEYMTPARRRFFITLEKIAARCSDVILSQNAEDMQTAIDEGICAPEKIKYLGNGIDLTLFDPGQVTPDTIRRKRAVTGLPTDAPVIGFVGRLAARRKGFLDFLAAGQRIVKCVPAVRFLVVGIPDHSKPDAVEPTVAKDYDLDAHCIFLGGRPNSELPSLYALMDVLVLPSLFEGVPRAVMEASAMGVPAVVTDVKGNREAVEPGRNGLLVPLGDVEALAEAVVDVLTDREKARHMSEMGRCLALERFDERLVFEKVRTEYARLLSEKGLPVPSPTEA